MTRYVVLDVETTGVSPERDRVVWVAAAVVESDGVVSQRWSSILNPGAGRRTHVDGFQLAGRPMFVEVAAELGALLSGSVLVGHNAPFDRAFLVAEYARAGLVMPDVPMICTMRLAQRLELGVASLSLVDCCSHFGIPHVRRHNADEDVTATVQLLGRLLSLAAARGWADLQELLHALAPADRSDELSYTVTIDLDQILAELLIEKAGWCPDDEPIEVAWQRYGAIRRAERDAEYVAMEPEHRAAHQQRDALELGETRAGRWLPVLTALESAGCPEAAETWVRYAKDLQGPRRNAKRAVQALHRALELRFAEQHPTRAAVNDAVTWLHITCDAAGLFREFLDAYQRWGTQLAALPPCGDCGDGESGCRAGHPCTTASMALDVVFALMHGLTGEDDLDRNDDPEQLDGRVRAALPLVAAEPDAWPYVHLASWFGRQLIERHNLDDAMNLWQEVLRHQRADQVERLPFEADKLAQTFAAKRDYPRAIAVATAALDLAAQHPNSHETQWRIADHLGSYLERNGQSDEATGVWTHAVQAGTTIANTFDRLSLKLERDGQYDAAAQVCEQGWKRFSPEVRRYQYALRIKSRGERCRNLITD